MRLSAVPLALTLVSVSSAQPARAAGGVHWRRNQQKEPEKLTGVALQNHLAGRKKGAGLGLPFDHGGTSMDRWDPALRGAADMALPDFGNLAIQ